MDLTHTRCYKTRNNVLINVYRVSGTAKELEEYRKAQEEHYCTDVDDTPLFFTRSFVGKNGKLVPKIQYVPEPIEVVQG